MRYLKKNLQFEGFTTRWQWHINRATTTTPATIPKVD